MPKALLRATRDLAVLPLGAKLELFRDLARGLDLDPGPSVAIDACLGWLCRAQELSVSADGGVARHFSLISGWGASYPETTGYILSTMLECGQRFSRPALTASGRRMADWLVSLQHSTGGFPGGVVGQEPALAVTFNTGQILLGLTSAVRHLGVAYRPSMTRAADWLVDSLDPDGAWRAHPTPFANAGEKAYETHVAWALFEAAKAAQVQRWSRAAAQNVDWALTKQRPNGWIADCCLNQELTPLTHTLGYALRGIIEAYRHTRDSRYLEAAVLTADALRSRIKGDGYLAGRWDSEWSPAARWACLTGTAQIAHSWLLLYLETADERYRQAARSALTFVRRTIRIKGNPDIVGGIKGAFPVSGGYGAFEYLNWAAKFYIDAQLLEVDLDDGSRMANH